MWYIYGMHIETGKTIDCGVRETAKEAIRRIRQLYNIDVDTSSEDEYFYYMRQH